jgi:hypothetical protein
MSSEIALSALTPICPQSRRTIHSGSAKGYMNNLFPASCNLSMGLFWTRRIRAAMLVLLCLMSSAFAQEDDQDEQESAVCEMDVGGAGSNSKPLGATYGTGVNRYLVNGVCYDLSGSVQATQQRARSPEPRVGGQAPTRTMTFEPNVRIEASKQTKKGPFRIAFESSWAVSSQSGLDPSPTLAEASLSYIGVKAGFAESLMNFWESEFQFTASAPALSGYMVSYQYEVSDDLKLSLAIEAGPPTSRGASTWLLPESPPFFTTQIRYEKDDWVIQASAAAHQVNVLGSALLGVASTSRFGWALTGGITAPLKFIAENDVITFNAAYAVDSAIFLGTPADVVAFAARFPTAAASRGWSALASYHHNWSDKWASNAFASFNGVDVNLLSSIPSVKTSRYGVNLIYQPDEKWTIGAELDLVMTRINLNGSISAIPGANLKGAAAFLWVKREL